MSKTVKAHEVYANVNEFTLVDVRTPHEFEIEKVEGATNIPLGDLAEAGTTLKDRERVVLVCASGNRACKAQEELEKCGVEAYVLDGGMKAWTAAGLPVQQGQSSGISLERQVRIIAGTMVAVGAFLALTVDPRWAALPAFVGCGLVFAGVTDTCGMAMVLAKLPYNRKRNCQKCA